METTRILWSGLTGRTGREAIREQANVNGLEIAGGLTRKLTGAMDVRLNGTENIQWYLYDWLKSPLTMAKNIPNDFDVVVDFSNSSVFEQVVELAVHMNVPLISGTSGLDDRQMAMLYDTTNHIPVFRGGNFRFKVKKFIDEAVVVAANTHGSITLFENFYEGKSLPSETSKVVRRRILEATGKTIAVDSRSELPKENLPCDWRLDLGTELRNSLHCHTVGFDELAHDVLEIAKVMTHKPIQKGKFYDLDSIWDELPHN